MKNAQYSIKSNQVAKQSPKWTYSLVHTWEIATFIRRLAAELAMTMVGL